MPLRFHHRIETALPLQSSDGVLEVSGWCWQEGSPHAPTIKLASERAEFEVTARHLRIDVDAAFGIAPVGGEKWGFKLRGQFPAGAHQLTLLAAEARTGVWHPLQRFAAVVFSRGLQASIEIPAESTLHESVRIQGWAAHPEERLREIFLHYGTRRVSCEFGLRRDDVPRFLASAPNAATSGFITSGNVPAGRSALRVAAIDSKGIRHIARTHRFVDIDRDEENPGGLDLPSTLARLSCAEPSAARREISRPTPARKLRVLFALYGDFTSNSAIHVAALANAMIEAGHECIVAVPAQPETVAHLRGARFRAVTFNEVAADAAQFPGARMPDVIHAWTTRENVRQFATSMRAATGAKLVVHLEDHEPRILELNLGRSLAELSGLRDEELDRLVPPTLSHPRRGKELLASADAVSVITEKLRELVPPGPKLHLFWPAADRHAFHARPIPQELRETLGFGSDHTVLFYHGNVHAANQREVRELYLAVAQLNVTGHSTTLLRTGRDFCDFLGADAETLRRHVINLGLIEKHHHLGPLMALADFFVQPGEPDAFNDYRFPSKLPEFFSSGRPVILPATNLGQAVRHRQDAYVLEKADAAGIADAVRILRADQPLRERLSAGAAEFAGRMFSWQRSADGLLNFYLQLTPPPALAVSKPHV